MPTHCYTFFVTPTCKTPGDPVTMHIFQNHLDINVPTRSSNVSYKVLASLLIGTEAPLGMARRQKMMKWMTLVPSFPLWGSFSSRWYKNHLDKHGLFCSLSAHACLRGHLTFEGVLIKLLDPATWAIGIDVKRISEISNPASVKQLDHMFVTVGTQNVCLFKIPPPWSSFLVETWQGVFFSRLFSQRLC